MCLDHLLWVQGFCWVLPLKVMCLDHLLWVQGFCTAQGSVFRSLAVGTVFLLSSTAQGNVFRSLAVGTGLLVSSTVPLKLKCVLWILHSCFWIWSNILNLTLFFLQRELVQWYIPRWVLNALRPSKFLLSSYEQFLVVHRPATIHWCTGTSWYFFAVIRILYIKQGIAIFTIHSHMHQQTWESTVFN